MYPSRRPRFTIGQVMALIVVLALLFAVPHLRSVIEIKVAACVVALGPIIFLANVAVEILLGIRCLECSRWSLRRLARNRSYARCSGCGGRCKRSWFGPWLDASCPEDDAIYRGKGGAKPWAGFSIAEDPGGTTTGLLLRNKRLRGRSGADRQAVRLRIVSPEGPRDARPTDRGPRFPGSCGTPPPSIS